MGLDHVPSSRRRGYPVNPPTRPTGDVDVHVPLSVNEWEFIGAPAFVGGPLKDTSETGTNAA